MILRLVAVALAASLLSFAQLPRGFFPWWDQPIAKNLNLTEAQKAEVKAAVREYRTKLIEQRAALEKAEVELQYIFDDDNVDARRANQAIEDLANARLNLTRTFSQVFLKVRLVLTPQQWHELQQRHDDRMEKRRLKKQ
jgi:Spy/CpxP family protein refolding chaperone